MRQATLLFYGVATLCLGMLALPVGPSALALAFGLEVGAGAWIGRIWTWATISIALFFMLWAVLTIPMPTRRGNDDDD